MTLNELKQLENCYQCQALFSIKVEGHFRLGEYNKVVDLISPISDQIINADIAIMHLRALVKLYQMDKLEKALEQYKTMKLQWFGYYNQNLLYWAICQELYLSGKTKSLEVYAKKMRDFAALHPDFITYEQDMYVSSFLLGDYKTALAFVKQFSQKFGGYYETDVVVVKVFNGDKQAGENFLSKSKPNNLKYNFGEWEYNRAKVESALGYKAQAIESLEFSHKGGTDFLWYNFQNDIFFKSLLDEPAFQELVSVKNLSRSLK